MPEGRQGSPREFPSAPLDITGRDAESPVLTQTDYVKAAFMWQYNLIALAGAAVFAMVAHDALPLLMAAGVELMYLSAVPQMERFRRLVRSWKAMEDQRLLDWRLARVAQYLPPALHKRYDELLGVCDVIRTNYYRLSSTAQNIFVAQMETRLKGLMRSYLGMVQSLALHNEYLRNTNPETIRKQLTDLEHGLEKCPAKVREINERRLEILKKRYERFDSVKENIAVIEAQCQAIEDVLALIRDQSVTLRDPQEISDQLENLLQDVENTHQTVREVEAIFEIAPSAGAVSSPGMPSRVRN